MRLELHRLCVEGSADHSGMSVDNGCVAVASRVNSMLWVRQFDDVGWAWRDEGQLRQFSRSDDGSVR
jgi:hypothetical protein